VQHWPSVRKRWQAAVGLISEALQVNFTHCWQEGLEVLLEERPHIFAGLESSDALVTRPV
jgi:hypothetical protein